MSAKQGGQKATTKASSKPLLNPKGFWVEETTILENRMEKNMQNDNMETGVM